MKRTFLATTGLVIFSLALGLPIIALAANVTFDAATTLSLPNGVELTIVSGATTDGLVVNDNSTLTVTVGSGTDITIRSEDAYLFTSDQSSDAYTCIPGSNSGENYSQIQINSTTGDHTISITATQACSPNTGGGTPPGGGGGGGAGTPPAVPSGTSVLINGGNSQTDTTAVTLTLAATNASLMLISNYSNFSVAGNWENYSTSKSWSLLSGVGTKTVYAKFRSSGGGESTAVSDTIQLVEAVVPTTGEIVGGSGGSVSLSDNKASVSFPAGAVAGTGTLSITPSSSYTAPSSGKQVVGNQIYSVVLEVSGSEVKTFQDLVILTFSYTDSEIAGIDESSLSIYYWDETASNWVLLGGDVDAANNKITVNTTHFTKFAVIGEKTAASGDLVKLACLAGAGVNDPCKAVYYIGSNSKRYVFKNEKTYKTWYDDFSTVKTVSATELASYIIGGNVTYRPSAKLIKIQTDSKVYAVGKNGTLHWVSTAAIAESLYGTSWSSVVEDIPDSFFVNYKTGSDITVASDYSVSSNLSGSPDINTDKGL